MRKDKKSNGGNSLASRMITHTGQNPKDGLTPQGRKPTTGASAGRQPQQEATYRPPGSKQAKWQGAQRQVGKGKRVQEAEAELEAWEVRKEHATKKQASFSAMRTKAATALLAMACIYIIFLIYGVFVTDYQYVDEGTVNPQLMSVVDIEEKDNFETVLVEYESCRMVYEQVLMLDYRVGQGEEDPLTISPLYTELLEGDVSTMLTKLNGSNVDPKYNELNNLMYQWLDQDTAQYLQYIAEAITENDYEKLEAAYACQNSMYSDFSVITQSVVSIGESIKGIDISDIKNWTPEGYMEEEINGA